MAVLNRDKKAYEHFVCVQCYNTLDKCDCEMFPPYHTVFIDKNIQECIRILNKKGYCTTGCCEGHSEQLKEIGTNTHIVFLDGRYLKDKGLPKGFKLGKGGRAIECGYSSKLSVEDMEKAKKENLAILLEWCKSLPAINNYRN